MKCIIFKDIVPKFFHLGARNVISLIIIFQIVGVGLRCVLELIKESQTSNPLFCTRALSALLDVLQGQQPQGLQGEPAEVMGTYTSCY